MTDEVDFEQLAERLASVLTPWFLQFQRNLTWRRTRDPYAIWVSEVMLQQTRVETVERYYSDFMQRFPTVVALAEAGEEDVLQAWSGLGYYRRARLLHRGARFVAGELGGEVPSDPARLRSIPGVGPYTAGALGSIAFDRPDPLVDGNIARVLSRVRAIEDSRAQGADAREHWDLTAAVLRAGSPRILAQALMELGATVCTPRAPQCSGCPVAVECRARQLGRVEGIPAPRVRSPPKSQRWAALAVVARRRLLLVRRPRRGLLGGLWALPLVALQDDGTPARVEVEAFLVPGPRFESLEARVRHVFTHRVWEITMFHAAVGRRPVVHVGDAIEEALWIAPGERPTGGVPSVTEKLLAELEY